MAGKFKYSYGGEDSTARKFRDLDRSVNQLYPSIAGSIAPALEYLTLGNGYEENEGDDWNYYTESNSGTPANPQHPAFSADYDTALDINVPDSGAFLVTVRAWIYIALNAYNNGQTQPISLRVRCGMFPVGWQDGQDIPDVSTRFGGAQINREIWGNNDSDVLGLTMSTTWRYTQWEPGALFHLRTQRFYWVFAADGQGNTIAMPKGSWARLIVGSQSISVTPVYSRSSSTIMGSDDTSLEA